MTIGRGSPYVFQSFQIINQKYRNLFIIHLPSIYDLLAQDVLKLHHIITFL